MTAPHVRRPLDERLAGIERWMAEARRTHRFAPLRDVAESYCQNASASRYRGLQHRARVDRCRIVPAPPAWRVRLARRVVAIRAARPATARAGAVAWAARVPTSGDTITSATPPTSVLRQHSGGRPGDQRDRRSFVARGQREDIGRAVDDFGSRRHPRKHTVSASPSCCVRRSISARSSPSWR